MAPLNIGKKIKRLRKTYGWSQEELCQKAHLKREYLSRVENGHTVPALSTLQRIAAALNVSLASLVEGGERISYNSLKTLEPVSRIAQEENSYQSKDKKVLEELEKEIDKMCQELKRKIREKINPS